MGLDISAYSRLRFCTGDVPEDFEQDDLTVWIIEAGEHDRLDGLPFGIYERTERMHLWWLAEHGTHAIPASEIESIEQRIRSLDERKIKPECPGDLAVLDEACPVSDEHGFRAGSYSGYNWWREQLCRFALECEPSVVWEEPERFAGKPFVELVNFSDCEGTIGPRTSAKLAQDFHLHAGRVEEWATRHLIDEDERNYFIESFGDWERAFELAAHDGFVVFH